MPSLTEKLAPFAAECTHRGQKRELCCLALRMLMKEEWEESQWWVRLNESMYRPNGQWRHR